MNGRLPGTVPHQIKLFGSYQTPFNLEVGALWYWSAGAYFTEGDRAYGIVIPHDLTPNDSHDFNFTKLGDAQHPSFSIFDVKFAYKLPLVRGTGLDLFLDIYNVFDNQTGYNINPFRSSALFGTPRLRRNSLASAMVCSVSSARRGSTSSDTQP